MTNDATSYQTVSGKIRSKPITRRLKSILDNAARDAGVTYKVVSGGQVSRVEGDKKVAEGAWTKKVWYTKSGKRKVAYYDEHGHQVTTGSTRHEVGPGAANPMGSADVDLYKDGQRLTWSANKDIYESFVKSAAKQGATGFGHSTAARGTPGYYMGDGRLHVGGGTQTAWGANKADLERWTNEAIREFQIENNLDVDGRWGPQTEAAYAKILGEEGYEPVAPTPETQVVADTFAPPTPKPILASADQDYDALRADILKSGYFGEQGTGGTTVAKPTGVLEPTLTRSGPRVNLGFEPRQGLPGESVLTPTGTPGPYTSPRSMLTSTPPPQSRWKTAAIRQSVYDPSAQEYLDARRVGYDIPPTAKPQKYGPPAPRYTTSISRTPIPGSRPDLPSGKIDLTTEGLPGLERAGGKGDAQGPISNVPRYTLGDIDRAVYGTSPPPPTAKPQKYGPTLPTREGLANAMVKAQKQGRAYQRDVDLVNKYFPGRYKTQKPVSGQVYETAPSSIQIGAGPPRPKPLTDRYDTDYGAMDPVTNEVAAQIADIRGKGRLYDPGLDPQAQIDAMIRAGGRPPMTPEQVREIQERDYRLAGGKEFGGIIDPDEWAKGVPNVLGFTKDPGRAPQPPITAQGVMEGIGRSIFGPRPSPAQTRAQTARIRSNIPGPENAPAMSFRDSELGRYGKYGGDKYRRTDPVSALEESTRRKSRINVTTPGYTPSTSYTGVQYDISIPRNAALSNQEYAQLNRNTAVNPQRGMAAPKAGQVYTEGEMSVRWNPNKYGPGQGGYEKVAPTPVYKPTVRAVAQRVRGGVGGGRPSPRPGYGNLITTRSGSQQYDRSRQVADAISRDTRNVSYTAKRGAAREQAVRDTYRATGNKDKKKTKATRTSRGGLSNKAGGRFN